MKSYENQFSVCAIYIDLKREILLSGKFHSFYPKVDYLKKANYEKSY